jgi:predicted phage tail protein
VPDRQVIVSPFPTRSPKPLMVAEGISIKGIITRMYEQGNVPAVWRDYRVMVEVNGEPVPADKWDMVPSVNDHVLVYVPLHGGGDGGKDPLRTILSVVAIAVAIAAPYGMAAMFGGNLLTFAGMSAGATISMYSGVALTASMMLIDAIAPVRQPDSGLSGTTSQTHNDSPTYSISGSRNQSNPWGPVPVILGKHRIYPLYGAKPYTEIIGNDEYLRMLFVAGYGRVAWSDIRIGETPITSFSDYQMETFEGTTSDADPTLIPSQVHQDSIGVTLTLAVGTVWRAARPNVDEISLDVVLPSGLCAYNSDGSREARNIQVQIYYREVGGASVFVNTISHTANTQSAIRLGYRFNVNRAKAYEVGLIRISPETGNTRIIDLVQWSVLRGIVNDPPVTFPHPLAMVALRIKATGQLNNVIDSFNAIVTSYAPTWDGSAWTTAESVTQNPAALFRHVLMHNANARRRTASQINDTVLGEWYTFCETNGYKFDMIRDYRTSVWECLADIAAAGRASPTLTDALWSAVCDTGDQITVQHISPRNSWGFEAEKTFYHRPHAFRIPFKNEDNDYQDDERIVYDDGYTSANATEFESIEFPGVTDPDLIWKFGRFHIAQARLRPETYKVSQDFEHLVCYRGAKVLVSHDVPMWGSGWARVKSLVVDGTDTTGVVLDEYVTMESGTSYACRFRLADSDNTSLVVSVTTAAGETNTLTFATAIPTTSGPQAGDLAMFGEADRETTECLVKSITRSHDFVAQLTLVDFASAVHSADSGTIPAFNPNVTQPVDVTRLIPAVPSIISVQSGTSCLEILSGAVRARMFVSLAPPSGSLKINSYKIRYRAKDESVWQFWTVVPENLVGMITGVTEGVTYEIQAQAISAYGVASAWTDVTLHNCIGQSEDPENVEDLACNIVGTEAHLSWAANTEADLSYYKIKWSPLTSGATWAAAVDIVAKVSRSATSVVVPAMVGTYLIKAIDYGGRESATAGSAITNIARISGLNVVETMTQPAWSGTGSQCEESGTYGGIVLSDQGDLYDVDDLYVLDDLYSIAGTIWDTGTYIMDDVIDLGSVYTSRLTASLTVSGQDLKSDLYDVANLYDMTNMYGDVEGLYSANLEVRTTNDDPAGSPTWSDWKPFLVGDYTARAYQFRIYLRGTLPGITPVVEAVTVTVDMPDRVVGFSGAIADTGGSIAFSPAFYEAPEIGITTKDGQEGDAYTISNLDTDGFDIAFTNGGVGVARNISGIAKGYGELEI